MILIVDGDGDSGTILSRVLKYRGLNALSVQDGMAALALLELRPPDLVILALQLRDMDGLILLQGIRKDPRHAKLPILIYTWNFDDETRRAALRYGAQEVIVKGTIGWESLVQRIRRLLHDQSEPSL